MIWRTDIGFEHCEGRDVGQEKLCKKSVAKVVFIRFYERWTPPAKFMNVVSCIEPRWINQYIVISTS